MALRSQHLAHDVVPVAVNGLPPRSASGPSAPRVPASLASLGRIDLVDRHLGRAPRRPVSRLDLAAEIYRRAAVRILVPSDARHLARGSGYVLAVPISR